MKKGGFFFTLLVLERVMTGNGERRWDEFWGPRGGLPLTSGADPSDPKPEAAPGGRGRVNSSPRTGERGSK